MASDWIDAQLNVDTTETWDGSVGTLDAGDYTFEVADSEKTVSQKGNPQIKVTFREVNSGKTVLGWYQIQGEGKKRLAHLVKVLGVPVNSNGQFDRLAFKGCKLRATIEKESRPTGEVDENGAPKFRTYAKLLRERSV